MTKTIIIKNSDVSLNLLVFVKAARDNDEIEMRYLDKYEQTAEYITLLVKKGCGWIEVDRGEKKETNNKCLFKIKGLCTNKKLVNPNDKIICDEEKRMKCRFYKQETKRKFDIKFICFEKAGGIRGL